MLRLKYFYLPPVELGVLSHLFGVQKNPKSLQTKDFGFFIFTIFSYVESSMSENSAILSYSPKNSSISSSTVPMPAIPKFSTRTFATLGERNAGSVGPR